MSRLVRKTRLRLLGWGLVDLLLVILTGAGVGLVGLVLLECAGVSTQWQRGLVLVCLIAIVVTVILKLAHAVWGLATHHRLCRLLEARNPEYRNDLTTLDYLHSHTAEVQSLGYSSGLMQALTQEVEKLPEPAWSRMGLSLSARRWMVVGGVTGTLVIPLLWFCAPGPTLRALQGAFFPGERSALPTLMSLELPATIGVPVHHDIVIPASGETRVSLIRNEDLPAGEHLEVLVKEQAGSWQSAGVVYRSEDSADQTSKVHLRVEGEMEVLLLSGTTRSNPCRIVPVYPPAVVSSQAVVVPPEYTHHPTQTLVAPARIEAMSGSNLQLTWRINNLLTSAEAEVLSETGAQLSSSALDVSQSWTLNATLVLTRKSILRLHLTDHFAQTTYSPDLPLFAYPDAIPAVQILSPSRETVLKDDLQVPLQVLATDDVALSGGTLVYRLENETGGGEVRQRIFDSAGTIPSASTVTTSPVLDLSGANLWPGERATYWIEVTDWRGPDRPGQVGRSEVFTARFPTVEETLNEQASMRAKTTDNFNELLEDQREISRQFHEMREDLQTNQKGKQRGDENWESQKKLEQTVKHQEDVQKKIADVAQQFENSLKRLEAENDISLRTLQKFEQVQDLLDQLLSDEAKQVLKELQETLKAMEKDQLRPEEMEQTETNLAEFEKQLDSQLELLKNMWLEQEAENLKKQTEQLALLQEELKKATQELQKQRDPNSATDEADLDNGLEDLEDLEEIPKGVEEQIQELADKALQEAKAKEQQEQATQNMKEGEKPEGEKAEGEKQPGETKTDQPGQNQEGKPEEKTQENATGEKPAEQPPTGQEGQQSAEQPQNEQPQGQQPQGQQPQGQQPQGEQPQPESGNEQLPPEEKQLADRQEQLNRETESLLDELKRLEEKTAGQDNQLAKSLQDINKSKAAKSVSKKQQSALSKLQQNQLQQSCKSQSSAKKDLDQMAGALGGCCGGKDMEEQIAKMKDILERAFVLSESGEGNDVSTSRYRSMRTWPNAENMSRLGRQMGLFRQEAARLSAEFKKVAEKNPFADFTVVKRFDQAARNWSENTRVMEEAPPVIVSDRSHQALGQVNLAIQSLLDSLDQSQSQSQSGSGGGLEGYFRGLKDMLQKQKQLNQQTQSVKEQMQEGNKKERLPGPSGKQEQPGEGEKPGEQKQPGQNGDQGGASEQLKKMAEQQRNIRRQLEELEKRYKDAKGRTGSLEGVGEMMQNVEKELDENRLGDQVTDTQQKIEQRLLDAEKSMHEKGFKKKRKALQAPGEAPEAVVEKSPVPTPKEEPESLARLLRQNLEDVSPHWRERIRTYYDSLLKMNP